jgi:hypothetical protein
MFPNNVIFLGQERDQARFQEAEHIRLVKIAQGQQVGEGIIHKVANWLGAQMMQWGARLRDYGNVSLPEVTSREVVDMK